MLVNVLQVEDLVLISGLVFAWKVVVDDDVDVVDDDNDVPFVFLSDTGTKKIREINDFFHSFFFRSGKP